MAEYIGREAAIKAVCDSSAHTCDLKNCSHGCQEAQAILAIPAADVRPVVRGKWIGTKEAEDMGDIMKEFTCSVCGCCDWDCTESESFNFCPNCGADMRNADD